MTPSNVVDEVDRVMSCPFVWGQSDCFASACDVFHAMYGVDPLTPLRGRYGTATGAARIIRSWGGFMSMTQSLMIIANLRPGQGETGEIGVSARGFGAGPEGRSMLICVQPGEWAGKTIDGFAIVGNAERCWRV